MVSRCRRRAAPFGVGTSSTSCARCGDALISARRDRRDRAPSPRFMRHVCSERPSTPCPRAHAPASSPAACAAAQQARASASSRIFRRAVVMRNTMRDNATSVFTVSLMGHRVQHAGDGIRDGFAIGRAALLLPSAPRAALVRRLRSRGDDGRRARSAGDCGVGAEAARDQLRSRSSGRRTRSRRC